MEIDLEKLTGDMEIDDFYRRNDRGKAVLNRLGVAINEPEKATVLSKEEVVGKILRRESFCVSIETLERVADEIDQLRKEVADADLLLGVGWQIALKATSGDAEAARQVQLTKLAGDIAERDETIQELREQLRELRGTDQE